MFVLQFHLQESNKPSNVRWVGKGSNYNLVSNVNVLCVSIFWYHGAFDSYFGKGDLIVGLGLSEIDVSF